MLSAAKDSSGTQGFVQAKACAVAELVVVEEAFAPHIAATAGGHGTGGECRVGKLGVAVVGAAENGSLDNGQTRHGVTQRVAVGDGFVVVEILRVLVDELLPYIVGGSHHDICAVLIVQFGLQEVVVEQVVLLGEHGVEVDGLTVDESAGHTLALYKPHAVEVVVVEERAEAVEVAVLGEILKDVGEELHLLVDGEEHAVGIKVVGCREQFATSKSGVTQLLVLAVHHGNITWFHHLRHRVPPAPHHRHQVCRLPSVPPRLSHGCYRTDQANQKETNMTI